jgi:hypothetical protein
VTSAKRVYAEVGSAGPGKVVADGCIDSVCQEKKDFCEMMGDWHVSFVWPSAGFDQVGELTIVGLIQV